jgi:hypothetical protein
MAVLLLQILTVLTFATPLSSNSDDNCHWDSVPSWYFCQADQRVYVYGMLSCDASEEDHGNVFCLPEDAINYSRCSGDSGLSRICSQNYLANPNVIQDNPCSWLGKVTEVNCDGKAYIAGRIHCGIYDRDAFCEDTTDNRNNALQCGFLSQNVSQTNRCKNALQLKRNGNPGGTPASGTGGVI